MSNHESGDTRIDLASALQPGLQRKILAQTELPALRGAILQVVQMASSDDDAIPELAHFVLSDLALTQKILRLANTAIFRANAGGPVSTVSKAIFVLGFELVRTTALAMLVVEGLKASNSRMLRRELHRSLCASVIGRELGRHTAYKEPEEAAVASLFRNLGRVLVAAAEPAVYERIEAAIAQGAATAARASAQHIGCSYDELGQIVLRDWQIPDGVIQAVGTLAPGVVPAPRNRQQWLGLVATFSMLAGALLPLNESPETDAAIKALHARFGSALDKDEEAIRALLAAVQAQAQVLVAGADLDAAGDHHELAAEALGQHDEALAADGDAVTASHAGSLDGTTPHDLPADLMLPHVALPGSGAERYPSGKPRDAETVLLAGVCDLADMIAANGKRTDMLVQTLETLYKGLGFDSIAVCLLDPKSGAMRARMTLGERDREGVAPLQFTPDPAGGDMFSIALARDIEVLVPDTSEARVAALLPEWYRTSRRTGSLMLLPLVLGGRPFALFCGERHAAAPEGLSEAEAALVRTLKGHLLRALSRNPA